MNRLVCLGLLSLTACAGPASVQCLPPLHHSRPCPACKCVLMPPSPTHRKNAPALDPWDTSHLQVAHLQGEHKPRTFHEHDLIEVLVRENSRSERTAEFSTQRRADLNAGINQWPNFRSNNLNEQLSPNYTQAQGLPTIAGTIQNRHGLEGEFEREDSFTARVMAEVAQVLPNGNLILEARSVTEVDGERSALWSEGGAVLKT